MDDRTPRNVARVQWLALCAVTVGAVLAAVNREWWSALAGLGAVAGWVSALLSTTRWRAWQAIAAGAITGWEQTLATWKSEAFAAWKSEEP